MTRPSPPETMDLRAAGRSLFDEGLPPEVPKKFNLAAYCLHSAQAPDDKTALLVHGALGGADADPTPAERWTYGALREAVERVSGGLVERGLRPGDVVLLRLAATSRFPLFFFGAIAAGGVAMPLSRGLSKLEIARIAEQARPRFACLEPDDPAAATLEAGGATLLRGEAVDAVAAGPRRPPLETRAEDPALLIYTSGSTGRPKGVLHAQRSALARRMMWRDWYDLRADDRLLHAGALNWTYTLGAGLMDPWAAGATAIVWQGLAEPTVWPALAEAAQPTLFAATPAHYRRILKYGLQKYGAGFRRAFSSLRHGLSAGEALSADLRAAWEREAGVRLYEALGMSECSTYLSASPQMPPPPGAAGRPQRGRRIALLPVEEDAPDPLAPVPLGAPGMIAIHARDPGLMLGYFNDPEATAAAWRGDWFLTGDLASMDAEGWLRYLGRADDQMNAMGFRVAPQEVEAALCETPGLAEGAAAETRLPGGVALIAFFATAGPGADPDALRAALEARAKAALADYKRPRAFLIVDELPRSANGKIQRRRLGEIGAERLTTP